MIYIKYGILKLKDKTGALGIEMILGVALAIIIAGFVLIPGLREFSQTVLTNMTAWWNSTVKSNIFPNS